MANVFSQSTTNVQSFKLSKVLLTIAGISDNLVCHGANFTYSQPVSPVIPLNATTKYLIVGEPSGNGNLSFILGPSKSVEKFLEKYGNACEANSSNSITLHGTTECGDGAKGNTFTLKGVVLNSISSTFSRGGGADLLVANCSFTFNELIIS